MEKNGSEMLRVFDENGNEIGVTWQKRARGLIKKGRARLVTSDSIVLLDRTVQDDGLCTARRDEKTEDTQIMCIFENTKNTEEIETQKTAEDSAEQPDEALNEAQSEPAEDGADTEDNPYADIDPQVLRMISDFKRAMTKAREEAETVLKQVKAEAVGIGSELSKACRDVKAEIKLKFDQAKCERDDIEEAQLEDDDCQSCESTVDIRREIAERRIDAIEKSAEQVLRVLDLKHGDGDISLDEYIEEAKALNSYVNDSISEILDKLL